MTTTEKHYLTVAETAKLLRKALAREFPGVKFSVRSSSYSGGASIDVRYTDGPPAEIVSAVAKRYEGAGFDGMIDLKYHHSHYLLPDGSLRWGGTHGHSFDNPQPVYTIEDFPEGTRVVSLGADYVNVSRSISPERDEELRSEIARVAGVESFDFRGEYDVAVIEGRLVPCGGLQHYQRYGDTIYHQLAGTKDYR